MFGPCFVQYLVSFLVIFNSHDEDERALYHISMTFCLIEEVALCQRKNPCLFKNIILLFLSMNFFQCKMLSKSLSIF